MQNISAIKAVLYLEIRAKHYAGASKSSIEAEYAGQLSQSEIRACLKGAATWKDEVLATEYKIQGKTLSIYEHLTSTKIGLPEGMITVAVIEVLCDGDKKEWAKFTAKEQENRVRAARDYAKRKAASAGLTALFSARVASVTLKPVEKVNTMKPHNNLIAFERVQVKFIRSIMPDDVLGVTPDMSEAEINALALDVAKEFQANLVAFRSGNPELIAKRKKRMASLSAQAVELERRRNDPAYI